jgi:hypothetical protein
VRQWWNGMVVGVGLAGLLGLLCCSLYSRAKGKSGPMRSTTDPSSDEPKSMTGDSFGERCVSQDLATTNQCTTTLVTPSQAEGNGIACVTLQRDDQQHVWFSVNGYRVLRIPAGDREGIKLLATWSVYNQCLGVAEAAAVHGVQPRAVEGYRASYAATHNSQVLIDRRRWNVGQRVAYHLERHKADLIRCATLNLLEGKRNTERGLAEQLGGVISDRSVGRHLQAIGWRAAEAAGLADEVAAYVEQVRRAAYWAGVAGQLLEGVPASPGRYGWQTPQAGVVGVSLGVSQLVLNGAYASLRRLVGDSLCMGHAYLVYLMKSGGGRISQAKHLVWPQVEGILIGCARASATGLRRWVVSVAKRAQDKISIRRSGGREESITRLQDYQEECVAQRAKRGLIDGRAIYVDDYVNTVYRREPIARTKHGTWARVVKAFRRHFAQDVDTKQVVTCPLGRSDVTPLAVLQQVVQIVRGGLERAGLDHQLELVIMDRWWSVKSVISWVAGPANLKMLTWGKDIKPIQRALAEVSEQDLKDNPMTVRVRDETTGQEVEKVVGYRLDTALSLYDLEQPVRGVVDWDGHADGKKRVRLVVGIDQDELDTQAVVDGLRLRQHVEILIKLMQRRLNLPAFGGGQAQVRPVTYETLDQAACHKLIKNHKQVATRLANNQAKLEQVEQELERVQKGQEPGNSLKLGRLDLKKVAQNLRRSIQRASGRLKELEAGLESAQPGAPPPPAEPVADLDLTRESILTQLKLDVFTAQESLIDDFIEHGLKPVLRQEAEQQAAIRQQRNLRSTAKGREGQPLCTDVEQLYQTKLANLERETILNRLLNQPGEFVRHKTQPIILMVFQRFQDRRIQAAFERYCVVLNQRDIRIPMDDGKQWRLLFTYHLDRPSSHAQFK